MGEKNNNNKATGGEVEWSKWKIENTEETNKGKRGTGQWEEVNRRRICRWELRKEV